MKKIVIIFVVVLVIGALYVYRDALMERFASDRCSDETLVWDPQRGECVSTDELEGEEEETPSTFSLDAVTTIELPIENATAGTVVVARSTGAEAFSTSFDMQGAPIDGFVTVLDEYAVYHSTSGDVLIPYAVNYGGSGSFVVLGLFSVRSETTLVLRDTYELGDRVLIDSVRTHDDRDRGYTAAVRFRDRAAGEPMAATPTVTKEARLRVENGAFGVAEVSVVETAVQNSYKDMIKLLTPLPGDAVDSPLSIRGEARGMWYFEASFPIVVVDWNGLIIGEGFATADGDWMTESYVPFTAEVSFAVPENTPYRRGAIIFQKSNASGLPEHDDAFEIPVVFE